MKIGIDGRVLMKPGSGIVRYSYDMVEALLKTDKKNEYVIYLPGNAGNIERLKFKGRYKVRIVEGIPPILWRTKFYTDILDKDGIDVYHSLAYLLPLVPENMRRVRLIATYHGLHSEYFKWPLKETLYSIFNYRSSAKFADRIIAVSQKLAEEIHKMYNVPYKKIDVTMTGVSDVFQFVSQKERDAKRNYICKKYNLGSKGYLVYIGAGMAANKNVETILKTVKVLREKYNFNLPIALTRIDMEKLEPRLAELGLKPDRDIIGLKWLDENDINLLYACAEFTVYATIYEGFGTVILESQAIGTPVITSNVSAMPEAAGGAALLVNNPMDPNEWAAKIVKLHVDRKLRDRLITLGLKNAKRFRYEIIAKATQKSYERAYKSIKQ